MVALTPSPSRARASWGSPTIRRSTAASSPSSIAVQRSVVAAVMRSVSTRRCRPPDFPVPPRYLVVLTNYTGPKMSSPTDDDLAPRLHSAVLHLLRRLARED